MDRALQELGESFVTCGKRSDDEAFLIVLYLTLVYRCPEPTLHAHDDLGFGDD